MFRNRLFAIKSGLTWLMTALLWLGIVPWLPINSAWAISSSTLPSLNSATTSQLLSNYGKLPISFEANQGQTDSQVDFLTRGSGYALFLTPDRAVLSVSRPKHNPAEKSLTKNHELESKKLFFPKQSEERVQSVVSMKLMGANNTAKPEGLAELEGKSNYLIGNDPSKWHTDIPNYGKVKYSNVYPGVDLVYYGNQQQLEYDFVVAAGVDPNVIQLQYEGAEQVALNDAGELVLKTAAGDVIEKAPVVYQEVNGKRQPIAGAYRLLENNQVAFKLGDYDSTRSVVIDPVLIYSTYLGGSSYNPGNGIAVDGSGNAYIIGQTGSIDFPTQNPLQGANADIAANSSDAFISKLNTSGNGLVYSTYLGGNSADIGSGIAVDSIGNAYLTGKTFSNNFPLANPLQASFETGSAAFISKLNPIGNSLIYSTYYLGVNGDQGNGIAVDNSGNAYVTGTTFNSNPPQGTFGGVGYDAFVVKISSVGSLSYSNFLGGNQNDSGDGIAVDNDGNVYVTGFTQSTNFPIFNPIQTCGGNGDAFVSKLNSTGALLLYSTCLGGSQYDFPKSIAIDSNQNTYVVGATFSSDFPLLNPLQSTYGGEIDGFVSKLNADGNGLIYSTYLRGTGEDQIYDIAVSSDGNAYVTGWTTSSDFPLKRPIQKVFKGGFFNGPYDAFVTEINAAGAGLVFSTYLGGNSDDRGNSIALDNTGNIYVTGSTNSYNFPIVNSFQSDAHLCQFCNDAFVSKISPTGSSDPADFNADAQSDLLWRNTNGTLVVWTMNGVTSTGGGYIGSTTTDWKVVGTGDFNKDGQADIFWRNDNGSLYVWYMNGLNYLSGSYVGSVTTDWKITSLADFNSDGNIDILWRNDNGTLAVWYMNGINYVNVAYIGATTTDWKIAGSGDFNNDRKPDLLWRNDNGSLAVWYLNGINYVDFSYIGQTSTDWKVVGVSDYNSDGKNDLIFENDNGTLGAWYLNGTTYLGFTYLNPNQVDPSWRIVAPH